MDTGFDPGLRLEKSCSSSISGLMKNARANEHPLLLSISGFVTSSTYGDHPNTTGLL